MKIGSEPRIRPLLVLSAAEASGLEGPGLRLRSATGLSTHQHIIKSAAGCVCTQIPSSADDNFKTGMGIGIEIFRTLLVPSAAEESGGEGQLNHRAKIRTLSGVEGAEDGA